MTILLRLLKFNDTIASLIAIIGNIVLMYLILTANSASTIKQLRIILLQGSIIDLFLAVSTLLTQIQCVIADNSIYLIIGSPLYSLGFVTGSLLINLYASFTMTSINALSIPFYVRYLAVCKNQPISKPKLIVLYSILLLFFILVSFCFFWCYPPISDKYEPYKHVLMTDIWLGEYPNGPTFVATKISSKPLILTYSFLFIISSFSICMIIYFSLQITRKLNLHITTFGGSKILNHQVQKTLIIQAIGPMIIGSIPIFSFVTTILLQIEGSTLTLAVCYFLGWIPMINPIAAIVIISPFRNRMKCWLNFQTSNNNVSPWNTGNNQR